jgi:hypothetical protein
MLIYYLSLDVRNNPDQVETFSILLYLGASSLNRHWSSRGGGGRNEEEEGEGEGERGEGGGSGNGSGSISKKCDKTL